MERILLLYVCKESNFSDENFLLIDILCAQKSVSENRLFRSKFIFVFILHLKHTSLCCYCRFIDRFFGNILFIKCTLVHRCNLSYVLYALKIVARRIVFNVKNYNVFFFSISNWMFYWLIFLYYTFLLCPGIYARKLYGLVCFV